MIAAASCLTTTRRGCTMRIARNPTPGLQFGLLDERRNWLFLRAGESAGMVVLQEDRAEWPQQHFAFTMWLVAWRGGDSETRSKGKSGQDQPCYRDLMSTGGLVIPPRGGTATRLVARCAQAAATLGFERWLELRVCKPAGVGATVNHN